MNKAARTLWPVALPSTTSMPFVVFEKCSEIERSHMDRVNNCRQQPGSTVYGRAHTKVVIRLYPRRSVATDPHG